MSQQRKLNCPVCNYPRLANLSDHLTKVQGINGQERKLYCEELVFQFYPRYQINLNHLYQKQILQLHNLVTVFQNIPTT